MYKLMWEDYRDLHVGMSHSVRATKHRHVDVVQVLTLQSFRICIKYNLINKYTHIVETTNILQVQLGFNRQLQGSHQITLHIPRVTAPISSFSEKPGSFAAVATALPNHGSSALLKRCS